MPPIHNGLVPVTEAMLALAITVTVKLVPVLTHALAFFTVMVPV